MIPDTYNRFERKIHISGTLVFETAFHIGSGAPGELATDMGVLKDPDGRPVLPGSSLKGCFRATAERLAAYLNLRACLLDRALSGIACVGDEGYRQSQAKAFNAQTSEADKLVWLTGHTCDVCRLFGSPMQASSIFFSDGNLSQWSGAVQIRDGVCLDRDSGTARHGAKYDFEVIPPGAAFDIQIELENPIDEELALVGAVLAEWENGFRLGGFTSRGLGRVRLTDCQTHQLDYADPDSLKTYLLARKMQPAHDLCRDCLKGMLEKQGGANA